LADDRFFACSDSGRLWKKRVTPESKHPVWNLPSEIPEIAIQLMMAGELDDRWPGSRKRAGREESPDTETAQAVWATRLVTPGELL
jgi:hypothetical protein